jgi:hypothetical protein
VMRVDGIESIEADVVEIGLGELTVRPEKFVS